MATTILLIIAYTIAAVLATIAIFNNDRLVEFEDRVFAEFKERRKIRKYERCLDTLREIRNGRN